MITDASCDGRLTEFLGALQERLEREVSALPAARAALPLVVAGGKRVRARLLWLAAATSRTPITAKQDDALLCAAVAIELAQLGSLIHDDIVDDAPMRRGVLALHRATDIPTAYRAGTALLHLASATVADMPARLRRASARAILLMCRGQVRELRNVFVLHGPRTRFTIMHEKTAALFELAALLGVALAGGSRLSALPLRRFGRCFGIAFQIADDVMDLVGDPDRLGRPNGSDLRDGVMTLPVILASKRKPALLIHLRRAHLHGAVADAHDCLQLIVASGAIEATAARSRRWLRRAQRALTLLPSSAPRSLLARLARASVETSLLATDRPVLASTPPGRVTPLDFRLLTDGREALDDDADTGTDLLHTRIGTCLRWIDPSLETTLHALLHAGNSKHRTSRAAMDIQPSAMAAFHVAQRLASEDRLRRLPIEVVATADCLHAACVAQLAECPAAEHAMGAHAMLSMLNRSTTPYAQHRTAGTPAALTDPILVVAEQSAVSGASP